MRVELSTGEAVAAHRALEQLAAVMEHHRANGVPGLDADIADAQSALGRVSLALWASTAPAGMLVTSLGEFTGDGWTENQVAAAMGR